MPVNSDPEVVYAFGRILHIFNVKVNSNPGFWMNFTHFHREGGHAPDDDFGYTLMRQSTVAFGRISHIFPMKVDSDPDGQLPDDLQSRVFAAFCGIFRTPSSWT